MQDLILGQRGKIDKNLLLVFAEQIGLDKKVFLKALDAQVFKEILDQDRAVGLERNIKGVPTLFINNKKMEGIPNMGVLSEWIEEALGNFGPWVPKG